MSFLKSALFLILSAASVPALADTIYVAPTTGSGVAAADLQSATELVQSSVTEVGDNEVASLAAQADFVLEPHLVRLGQAYVMSLTKSKNGEVVYSSQLKAEKIDELDKVAQRLTRSVLEGKRAASHPRVGEITDQEAKDGAQRRPNRKSVYLGFGPASLHNLNTTGVGFSLGAAYSWDVNTARIKILGEGDFNGSAFFASAGLGGNYYFGMEDIAPYLSADFGGGVAKIDQSLLSGQTVGGFVLGAGAGVEFLRTSSVNLDLAFHAGFLLHQNQMGTPESYVLRLGIYF